MNSISFQSPAELVIIGAGTVGLYLASKLPQSKKVLLLESGCVDSFNRCDPKNAVFTTGSYKNGQLGRARGLGGTTNIWGGQMLPFSSHDLTPEKGWMIDWQDLQDHYEEVSQFLLSESSDYHALIEHLTGYPLPNLNSQSSYIHASKWLPIPQFIKTLFPDLEPNVTLVPNCTVHGIEPQELGYQIHLSMENNENKTLIAQQLIIATGTIESIRLLLYSHKHYGLPLNPVAGKGFMDHLSLDVSILQPINRFHLLRDFNTRWAQGKKYSVRISASEKWIKEHNDLNVSAMIIVRPPKNKFLQVGNQLFAVLSAFCLGFVYKPWGKIMLNLMAEQYPDIENSVSLSDANFCQTNSKEEVPIITWKPQVLEVEVLRNFALDVLESLSRTKYILNYSSVNPACFMREHVEDVCHPMGGLPMHADTTKRVVDRQLELEGNSGLYVCSAAVFPSGSHSNPTMTLLALANRLAKHLAHT